MIEIKTVSENCGQDSQWFIGRREQGDSMSIPLFL